MLVTQYLSGGSACLVRGCQHCLGIVQRTTDLHPEGEWGSDTRGGCDFTVILFIYIGCCVVIYMHDWGKTLSVLSNLPMTVPTYVGT